MVVEVGAGAEQNVSGHSLTLGDPYIYVQVVTSHHYAIMLMVEFPVG